MDSLEELRTLIIDRKLNRAKLCEEAGLNQAQMSKFLQGKQSLIADTFLSLVSALGGKVVFEKSEQLPQSFAEAAEAMSAGFLKKEYFGMTALEVVCRAFREKMEAELRAADCFPPLLRSAAGESSDHIVARLYTCWQNAERKVPGYGKMKLGKYFFPMGPLESDLNFLKSWMHEIGNSDLWEAEIREDVRREFEAKKK